jgi:hypothetical protein
LHVGRLFWGDTVTAWIPQPKVLYNSLPTDFIPAGAVQIHGYCSFDSLPLIASRWNFLLMGCFELVVSHSFFAV